MSPRIKRVSTTKDGSPVYQVEELSQFSGRSLGTDCGYGNLAIVHDVDGTTYNIPINPRTGRVTDETLLEHFIASGQGGFPSGDMVRGRKATIKVPRGGFTPEQLVACGWWQDPGSVDIEGIDDGVNKYMATNQKVRKAVGGRVLFMGPRRDIEGMQDVLAKNFTMEELRTAARAGLIVRKMQSAKSVGGRYIPRQTLHETPQMRVHKVEDENVTHEFVHHLRYTDPSRTGITRHYAAKDVVGKGGKKYSEDTMSSVEEAATVAESYARIRKMKDWPNGYYGFLSRDNGRVSPKELSDSDRELLMESGRHKGPKSGKDAVDVIDDEFLDTNISGLRSRNKGASARTFAQDLADGKVKVLSDAGKVAAKVSAPKPRAKGTASGKATSKSGTAKPGTTTKIATKSGAGKTTAKPKTTKTTTKKTAAKPKAEKPAVKPKTGKATAKVLTTAKKTAPSKTAKTAPKAKPPSATKKATPKKTTTTSGAKATKAPAKKSVAAKTVKATPKASLKARSKDAAVKTQAQRTTRARGVDSQRMAKRTFPADYNDEEYAIWAASPGRYDIDGIDTPSRSDSKRSRRHR